MYPWPTAEIAAALDRPVLPIVADEVRRRMAASVYGPKLADFLADFYSVANGATFFDGAFRVLPLDGIEGEAPGLLEWNDPTDWKEFAPAPARTSFVFLSNAFGDLFGVPLDGTGDLARNTTTALWIEKHEQEESKLGWDQIFPKLLKDEQSMATFLARLQEVAWAVPRFGHPGLHDCYSWILPPIMGGPETLDNLQVVSNYVHVSFTLQILQKHLHPES